MKHQTYAYAGLMTTSLRWVAGWTYFSAFWRRLILENKLDPYTTGYIGEKFNHFLPHALGIKPIIEYLVTHPDALWWSMVVFTIVEGVVGFFFMLGLFTRMMSFGVLVLAFGILLGSGWLGTTCLDEWQIGVLGVASGFTIFLTGGGKYSLDNYLLQRKSNLAARKWFAFLGSAQLPIHTSALNKIVLGGSILILSLTLFTNQYFHGGVFGKLHNLSVRPHVSITDAHIIDDKLAFTVFRDEGADVYGSFLISIKLLDQNNVVVFEQNQEELATLPSTQIDNEYVAKVKSGAHSLILPLGAKATLHFQQDLFRELKGLYKVQLLDISGLKWEAELFTK